LLCANQRLGSHLAKVFRQSRQSRRSYVYIRSHLLLCTLRQQEFRVLHRSNTFFLGFFWKRGAFTEHLLQFLSIFRNFSAYLSGMSY